MLQKSKDECEDLMKLYHEKLKLLENKLEDGTIEFTGYAFVTFLYAQDANVALETIRRPEKLLAAWTKLRHVLCFYTPRSRTQLCGKNVIVTRPEEPQDIVWENLGGKESQVKIRLATGCATFGLLAICFCVVMASAVWKKYLIEEQSTDDDEG